MEKSNRFYVTGAAFGLVMTVATTLAASLFTSSAFAADYYKPLKRLGGTSSAICKPPINTASELQAFFRNQPQDVIDILAAAGWDGGADAVFNAVEAGNFTEQMYSPGTRLEWMGFRRGGGIVAEPREWAGNQAFEGFEVTVPANCQILTLVVPKDCCNLSFLSASPVGTSQPRIQISQSGEGGSSVNVSVLGDCDATTATLTRPDGTTEQLPLNGGAWQGSLPPGDYMITANSNCECGSASAQQMLSVAAPAMAVMAAPMAAGGLYIAPFLGREIREVDPLLVGIDVGYAHPVAERVDAFVQGGVSYNTDTERESVYADVGIDFKVGETGFIGGGVGLWDITADDEDDKEHGMELEDTTYFLHGGADTPWVVRGNNVQWFVEGRVFSDHTDDISAHNILKAGVRIKP